MENQFQVLETWTFEILEAIKKDIKQEHMDAHLEFYRKYFGNRPKKGLTTTEIFSAYAKELSEGNEEFSAWIVNRWVFKNGELYEHFVNQLSSINPDFASIETLNLEESQRVLEGAEESFGAIPVFLFSLLNGVVFPKTVLMDLEKKAEIARQARDSQVEQTQEQQSFEKVIASQQREITRLEAKLLGVQKKYTRDTEALKKHVKALQKQQ